MNIVNEQEIDDEISNYGTSITLVIKNSTYTDYGDESCSTTSVTFVAVHNDMSGEEDFNKEGIYSVGDKVFFAKHDQTNLDEGNEIIYNSDYFRINQVINHHLQEQDYVKEVRCVKVK
jgi:hypothetical protein